MKTCTFSGPRYPNNFQNGYPKSATNQNKMKLGLQRVLSFGPRCPKIDPRSPRTPKWRHRACQMTSSGTKKTISLPNNAKNYKSYSNEQWSGAGGRGCRPFIIYVQAHITHEHVLAPQTQRMRCDANASLQTYSPPDFWFIYGGL